jgi:hypothetical protein
MLPRHRPLSGSPPNRNAHPRPHRRRVTPILTMVRRSIQSLVRPRSRPSLAETPVSPLFRTVRRRMWLPRRQRSSRHARPSLRRRYIRNPLNKARTNNLPPDKPGIIFVKVPQTWLDQEDVRRGIYALVEGFLRNTERIVSVVVYATVAMELAEQNMTLLRHRFHEFPQPLASLRQDEELGAVQGLQGPGGMGWSAPELGTCVLAGLHHAGQMNVRCPLLA